ncbi:MAG: SpoVR family protein [Planctomycetes bacterium]|nr:SpoVR family protein [Planctomycetota bacterium]
MDISADLAQIAEEIKGYARESGLDFFETIFEIVDYRQMNEIASLGGFPTRYPHWQFGMEYEYMQKSYTYGLHKIYEMVINNDPCYAYLFDGNHLVDQKLVIAHVFAHCDFFKNNLFFANTNRKMVDEMANHAARVTRYAERFGHDTVENFLDRCLSVDNLIDIHSLSIRRRPTERPSVLAEEQPFKPTPTRFESLKAYLDPFINPPEVLRAEQERQEQEARDQERHFPAKPEQDVLQFLIEHAPLANWQRDILSMVREEAYYFAPQAQTKIMNEGWATFWHSRIMTEKALTDAELIDFADHHSSTVHALPNQLNPYKLGVELFRDIEERWNRGQFGKEYDECEDLDARRRWDRQLGLGLAKIFEVRRIYNDINFIDAFLTPEFCRKHQLFVYAYNERNNEYEISDREFKSVKEQILTQLTNYGNPFIFVEEGNYQNRGELLLRHQHEGMDLRTDHARDVLENLSTIWTRPVHLSTVVDGKPKLLSFVEGGYQEKEL